MVMIMMTTALFVLVMIILFASMIDTADNGGDERVTIRTMSLVMMMIVDDMLITTRACFVLISMKIMSIRRKMRTKTKTFCIICM